jgi:GNAT superfamily N-acetyltransferase
MDTTRADIEIRFVQGALPPGFELLRHAADGEAYNMLAVLAKEWADGTNRFEKPGEALVAAYEGEHLAGLGAMTHDPNIQGALRMRRFYVSPRHRRSGIGRALARALLDRPEVQGKLITLNAPQVEAARFWEALGFVRDNKDGHTHVRMEPYSHA